MKILGMLAAAMMTAGCATQNVTASSSAIGAMKVDEVEGRVTLDGTRISALKAEVIAQVSDRLSASPLVADTMQCQTIKSVMANSRKAWLLEDCVLDVVDAELQYAGQSIEQMRYRFTDDRLLQMELVFASAASSEPIVDLINSELPGAGKSLADIERNRRDSGQAMHVANRMQPGETAEENPDENSGTHALAGSTFWSSRLDEVELFKSGARLRLRVSDSRLLSMIPALVVK